MTLLPLSLVLLSGMFHSIWNLFTKQSLNKSVFLITAGVILLGMCG